MQSLIATLRDAEQVNALLPHTVVVESFLQSGGQGVVHYGQVDGVDAAIKVYFPGNVRRRVDREIKALKELKCRSIVTLLFAGEICVHDHELPVVATSFVSGKPLDALIAEGPLELEHIGVIAYDVLEAIDHMWAERIVHRDLKPSNIIMSEKARACVIDLGVARHLDTTSLTAAGATWGTHGYFSPEQARCVRQLSCKSDIFTLGVIMVEAALGRHPSRRDQQGLFTCKLHEALPLPLSAWKHAPVLELMLEPHPTKRPKPGALLSAFSEFGPQ